MSIFQHERVLYVVGPLTTESVAPLVLQLLSLNDESGLPVHLYLTSPGGDALTQTKFEGYSFAHYPNAVYRVDENLCLGSK